MANLGNNMKTAFLKGLEALGKGASSLTNAAQHKINEMNLDSRRREILSEIPKCVMEMWQNGVELPDPLGALLSELNELDQQLAAMRPQPAQDESAQEASTVEEAVEQLEDKVENAVDAVKDFVEETVDKVEDKVEAFVDSFQKEEDDSAGEENREESDE